MTNQKMTLEQVRVPDAMTVLDGRDPIISGHTDSAYAMGWNACREALLAQGTEKREQAGVSEVIERLREIAYRDEAKSVTVRADDLREALEAVMPSRVPDGSCPLCGANVLKQSHKTGCPALETTRHG